LEIYLTAWLFWLEKNNMLTVNVPVIWDKAAIDLRDECANMITDVVNYMEDAQFHMALATHMENYSSGECLFS